MNIEAVSLYTREGRINSDFIYGNAARITTLQVDLEAWSFTDVARFSRLRMLTLMEAASMPVEAVRLLPQTLQITRLALQRPQGQEPADLDWSAFAALRALHTLCLYCDHNVALGGALTAALPTLEANPIRALGSAKKRRVTIH